MGKTQEDGRRMGLYMTLSVRVFSSAVCVCVPVCVCVSVCESVREEGTFSSQPPAAFAFTGETRQPDLFCFLLERKGKGQLCVFPTVDLIFTHSIYMYGGTHEKQRERAGEWVVEWLNIRMYQSGRLL